MINPRDLEEDDILDLDAEDVADFEFEDGREADEIEEDSAKNMKGDE